MATAKKTAKKSPKTKPLPKGYSKITMNFPTKLVNQFKKEADRMKKSGKIEDFRWGYQSLMREHLEKVAAKFRA